MMPARSRTPCGDCSMSRRLNRIGGLQGTRTFATCAREHIWRLGKGTSCPRPVTPRQPVGLSPFQTSAVCTTTATASRRSVAPCRRQPQPHRIICGPCPLRGDHLTRASHVVTMTTWLETRSARANSRRGSGPIFSACGRGRTIVVTDRGQPVAELRPLPTDDSLPSTLLKLATTGAVTLPTVDALSTFRPIRNRGASVSDAVRKDREDRL